MCGSMVDIQSPAAEIRRGKKIVTTGQKYNGLPYYILHNNAEQVKASPVHIIYNKFSRSKYYRSITYATMHPIITQEDQEDASTYHSTWNLCRRTHAVTESNWIYSLSNATAMRQIVKTVAQLTTNNTYGAKCRLITVHCYCLNASLYSTNVNLFNCSGSAVLSEYWIRLW